MPGLLPITNRGVSALALTLLLFTMACNKPATNEQPPGSMAQLIRPEHFPPAHYTFDNNPYSEAGFELGRSLFFDPILSVDSTVSCASCHHQQYAFADPPFQFSKGIYGRLSTRNSPPVFNMAWNRSFMWDGGVNHIEVMPFAPIINPVEMGEDLGRVVDKLRAHLVYPTLFRQVFQQDELTDQQLFWALAQYMGNLVSANSRYDQFLKGETELTTREQRGLSIFRQHCATCHQEPLLTDGLYHNNGLDTLFTDAGRYRISQDSADMGAFKTPTLRNIALTAPYMHDGRFESLQAVVEHYRFGVQQSSSLAEALQQDTVVGIPLTDAEADDLLSFLHTLTDHDFITHPELSPAE